MMDDFDLYSDADPNDVPDDGAGQDATAGDGLPGVPVEGYPGLRAGAFGQGRGGLGLVHESDLLAPPSQDRQANPLLMRVSNAGGPTVAARDGEVYPLPPGYMPGPHGGVQLRPDYAKTLPKGPFDFGGMAREIGWPGVVNSLNHIAAGVFTSKANDQIGEWLHLPEWLDLPKVGRETLDAQIEANKDPKTQPRGADRVTNGLP